MLQLKNAVRTRISTFRMVSIEPADYGWARKRVTHARIEFPKGPVHGVYNGWRGYLADKDGNLVPGTRFIVKYTSRTASHGFLRVTQETIMKNQTVVLSEHGLPRRHTPIRGRLVRAQLTKEGLKLSVTGGSWQADVDGGWMITGRAPGSSKPEEFEILAVNPLSTDFIADGISLDSMKSYTDWQIVPKRRARHRHHHRH